MYVCLWSPDWSTDGASDVEEAGPLVAEMAPRVRVEREFIWADGRWLDAQRLAERLVDRLSGFGMAVRAGVAAVPVAAALAARWGATEERPRVEAPSFVVKERTGWGRRSSPSDSSSSMAWGGVPSSGGVGQEGKVIVVKSGEEREWLASLPISALEPHASLRPLLEGVGVDTVGALAALEREAVEVRLGAEAVSLWRLARADDRRLLFDPVPPERPHGSIDFIDYVLTDPSRLLFTANALLGPICERLGTRGEHARTLRLTLPLANGQSWERVLRPARPTASRESWLRMVRGLFDRLTVSDAVAGMRIDVESTEEAAVHQGDLFDRGFATATAVEAAVSRLAERQLHPLTPDVDAHPLIERRGRWMTWTPGSSASVPTSPLSSGGGAEGRVGLGLQLLPEPKRLAVETRRRRDHEVPARMRDLRGWREVVLAAGPDRISGGQWEAESYAREYFRCVTQEGVLLWIYRDALGGAWYLHGWWD